MHRVWAHSLVQHHEKVAIRRGPFILIIMHGFMRSLTLLLIVLTAGIAWAATTYRYECPTCHLIQEFGVPGIHKCLNDGLTMIPKLGK
jgi:hypothetical protein